MEQHLRFEREEDEIGVIDQLLINRLDMVNELGKDFLDDPSKNRLLIFKASIFRLLEYVRLRERPFNDVL